MAKKRPGPRPKPRPHRPPRKPSKPAPGPLAPTPLIERRNQKTLTPQDWQNLIDAINSTHGTAATPPTYRDFVRVHVDAMSPAGMAWGVHTMPWMGMDGRNFLAWHRRYLAELEKRLRRAVPGITVPYWDWTVDRQPPAPLSDPALLSSWSVTRGSFNAAILPTPQDVTDTLQLPGFQAFQSWLEQLHGSVHNAVGGTMASSSSPADPIFWLHHANVDRLWSVWQASPLNQAPPNVSEVLQPSPILGVPVSSELSISALGYRYV
jgi:tyrosinase